MDTDAGCPCDILINFSEPVEENFNDSSIQEDKENSIKLTDSIEISRRDCTALPEPEERILQEVTATRHKESSVALIEDEIFDFDLPDSPDRSGQEKTSKDEADEEVFFGPVGFTEKCIAAGVTEIKPLSPLRPDQMVELAKEAYSIAYRIANMKTSSPAASSTSLFSPKAKRTLLGKAEDEPKREAVLCSEASEEGASPTKQLKFCDHFTKDDESDNLTGNPEKEPKRKGTFTKEEPVENLLALRTMATQSGEKGTKPPAGSRLGLLRPKSGQQASKLQAPTSRLTRVTNSQPNLVIRKPSATETEKPAGNAEATSSTNQTAPVAKRSLQIPKTCKVPDYKAQHGGRNEDSVPPMTRVSSPDENNKPATARQSKIGVRRAQSLNIKSGLPSRPGSRLALPSQKTSAAAPRQESRDASVPASTSRVPAGIPRGPATKLQLMQPGQLQRRSFAMGRGKSAAPSQSGPMKVPAQPAPKMGDTVERPYNPQLAAAAKANGNSQCPNTPVGEKRDVPKKMLSLSSEGSTPARSSCSSSSACGSTPGSVSKRLSMLPTPSKRGSVAGSLPPPSPLSVSSINSSKLKWSLGSSSDAPDSPTFDPKASSKLLRSRNASGFKTRKALVQNTPDVPKRTMSRWSPLRRQRAPFEDEVSMCTKRVTPPN
ncbi:G2 and S phase-expressed protein 1-like isoform X2 [Littorina saxatilis]|uniref:G2 and S phase-expressed protein 1-like isoform X2 n=1 Tax=Littorina saxatilis TaxID=31220 RepID=UPI0038B5D9ED